VPEVGVDAELLAGPDLVVDGVLGGRRADPVLHGHGEQHLGRDPVGQVLDVDVAELTEDETGPLVQRVVAAEIVPELLVGAFAGQVQLPHPQVVGQERVGGGQPGHPWFQRGTGHGQSPALGGAHGSDPAGVDLGPGHDDAGQLDAVQEDVPVQQVARAVLEAADDVAVEGGPVGDPGVLGGAALAPAVQRGHAVALGGVRQLVEPVAAAGPVPVEHQHGRASGARRPGADVLGVHPGPAHPGEGEVETFRPGRRVRVRDEFDGRVDRVQLGQSVGPVAGEVLRPGITAAVTPELFGREIETRHAYLRSRSGPGPDRASSTSRTLAMLTSPATDCFR
jgi:hypothetical protein